jgi:GNAT superfamily N-acetyltransferase
VIRPLREDEFDAWRAATRDGYAYSIEFEGGVPHDAAQKKADDDFAAVLPDGIATKGHLFYVVDEGDGPVGDLWLAEREGMSGPQLFVYDVHVDEAQRGKGYGRRLMEFADEEARRLGLPRIALNVFGGNEVARQLYRSLGYYESAVFMVKEL